jgi:MFS family permease
MARRGCRCGSISVAEAALPGSEAPRRGGLLTYENGLLLLLGVTFGIVFIDRNALTTLMPFIQREFALTNTQVGLLAACLSITWGLSGYAIGALSDRAGRRKPFLIVAVLLFSATTLLSGFAQGFAGLLLARLAMGLAEGPVFPLSQSLLALSSSAHRRGLNAGLMQATITSLIGLIAAPVLLVAVAGHHGWRAAFFVAALPGLVMALLMMRFIREPKVAKPAAATGHGRMPQLALLRVRNVMLCLGIAICSVSWMVIAWAFLPLYFIGVRHFAPSTMGYLLGSLGISSAIFGLALPALSDRIGRKPVVLIFSAIALVMPIGVAFGPADPLLVGILLLIGWSASGIFPIFMATIPSESVPAASLGAAIGLVGGIAEVLGGFFGPPVAGLLADRFGLGAPLVLMGALAVVATLLALGLTETHPRKARAI